MKDAIEGMTAGFACWFFLVLPFYAMLIHFDLKNINENLKGAVHENNL